MAKKSRKKRSSSKSVKPVETVVVSESVAVSATVPTVNEADFTDNYVYVYHDLRTMILITLLMIAVMVALSYVM